MMWPGGFTPGELPPALRALDRALSEAIEVARDTDAVGCQRAVGMLAQETAELAHAHRLLAEAVRFALLDALGDRVGSGSLATVITDVARRWQRVGIEVNPQSLTLVMVGAFGLAPTRADLEQTDLEQTDLDHSGLDPTAGGWVGRRPGGEPLIAADPLSDTAIVAAAVLVLAEVTGSRRHARRALDAAWVEIARAEAHDE